MYFVSRCQSATSWIAHDESIWEFFVAWNWSVHKGPVLNRARVALQLKPWNKIAGDLVEVCSFPALLEKQVTEKLSLQFLGCVERPAALGALSHRGIQIEAVGGLEVLKAVLWTVSFENWHNNKMIIALQFLGNCEAANSWSAPPALATTHDLNNGTLEIISD